MFDKKKPYGTIYGPGPAKYEQDGILYDGAGNVVDAMPVTNVEDVLEDRPIDRVAMEDLLNEIDERLLVQDPKDKRYVSKPVLLKILDWISGEYDKDKEYKPTDSKPVLVAKLREVIDGLEYK